MKITKIDKRTTKFDCSGKDSAKEKKDEWKKEVKNA